MPEGKKDEFETGFDTAVMEDGETNPTETEIAESEKGEAEKEKEPEKETGEPTTIETKEEETGKEVTEEDTGVPELGEGETVETLTQKYKSLQGMFKTKIEEARAQAIEEIETQKPPKEEKEPIEPELSKAEDFVKTRLAEISNIPEMVLLKEDAPDVYGAMMKIVETQENRILQMTQAIVSILDPVMEKYETTEESEHHGKIFNTHEDYETLRDSGAIETWIKEQSPYKQKAYLEAYYEGTAQDVIDLITDFKKAKGINAPSKKKEEMDEVPIKELEEIETVKPTRTSIYPRVDKAKDDYDAGFEAGARSA